jgi:hypothetical protein
MKKILATLLLIIGLTTQAQSVFDYDYVIVPERFDFQNSKHQFQLNSLLRVLFQKEGFTVLMNTEEKPDELAKNPCLALTTKVEKLSSLLNTKFKIKLVDCYNKVIFESKIGKSNSKAHKKGFKEGIKDAFTSIQKLKSKKINQAKEFKPIKKTTAKVAETSEYEQLITYKKDGENFTLDSHNDQYKLFQDDKKIADIIPNDDGSLRYKSKSITGNARFTPKGDLVVTYQDQDIGRQVEMTFYKIQE